MRIRQALLAIAIIVTVLVGAWALYFFPGELAVHKAEEVFAVLGLYTLYLALLHTPLYEASPKLPLRRQYYTARRSLGICAFVFSLAHGLFAFFGELGGIGGIASASALLQLAIILGVIGLMIFTAMVITSNDILLGRMGFVRWKALHRLVYLAAIAILVHSLLLGGDFYARTAPSFWIFYLAMILLLPLEARRLDRYLNKKYAWLPHAHIAMIVAIAFLLTIVFNVVLGEPALGVGVGHQG